jgi:hypothetical protein
VEAAIQAVERVGNFGDLKREELTQEFGQPRFDMMHQILATLRSLSASKDPQP